MKPYNELTKRGKLRRQRQLALKALEHYDLDVKDFRLLAAGINTIYRIDTQGGEKYAMRIYSPEETVLQDNQAEIFWLKALNRDTDLRVPEPIPQRSGAYITIQDHPYIPGERRCVVFKWIPGRSLAYYLSHENYNKLGEIMARLHTHAESLHVPHNIQPKRWDKVFYYPDEPVVIYDEQYRHLFSPERVELLEDAISITSCALSELHEDDEGRILIHGDLHYWNVHLYRGELYINDFEDIMLGYPVQDVAVTLSYGRTRDDYSKLREAFQEGYTNIRTWPVVSTRQLETLITARNINFINYIARVIPDPEEMLENRFENLKTYLYAYG